MARKKKEPEKNLKNVNTDGIIGLVGGTSEQAISETLEINYMPYAMSVIVSRAIPEIDGFKPSHRKLLYTMYKMGLLTGKRTKSANIVGQTMKLNPHLWIPRVTSVRSTPGILPMQHPDIRKPSWNLSARNCSGISTATR